MWLLAGFSSSQGVGLRASVLGTNDIMAACSIRLSKEETSVSMKARVRAREGLSQKVKSFITEIFMWYFITVATLECYCKLCAQSLGCILLFVTPWSVAHQVLLSMGFSSKNTGIGHHFLLQGIFQMQGSIIISHYNSLLTDMSFWFLFFLITLAYLPWSEECFLNHIFIFVFILFKIIRYKEIP